jgi:hypothetical protein
VSFPKAIVTELAKTAVFAREKRAGLQKSAEGFQDLLGQAGTHISNAWNGLSPEMQWGVGGAGLGGLYGAATARPGHMLEDTAYGAGVVGLGGYAGGTLLAGSGPKAMAKTPKEKALDADAATAADTQKHMPQQGLLNSISEPGVTQAAGGLQAAGNVGAVGAGYFAGRRLTSDALHKTLPTAVQNGWQSLTPGNEAALKGLGHPADIAKVQRHPAVPPTPARPAGLPADTDGWVRPGTLPRNLSGGSTSFKQLPSGVFRNTARIGGGLGAAVAPLLMNGIARNWPESLTPEIGGWSSYR